MHEVQISYIFYQMHSKALEFIYYIQVVSMEITVINHFFKLLMIITVLFQLALVTGMPRGEFTLGGKYPGVLPKNK
jgi:hypothetical protein